MGVKNTVALWFGMPIVDIFEARKFLETIIVVGMVFDKVLCLVNELSQKYANLLETWEIGLPTVWNPSLALTDRANISRKVGIVPKFWEELLKPFRRDELPKPVERPVGGS